MIRAASAADQPFLVEMLVAAVNWPEGRELSPEAVLADPSLAHYVFEWPAPGELGVVAELDDTLVGAAWLRFLTHQDSGYGYVADDVPELSLGVLEGWRGRGIGRALLRELVAAASEAGTRKLSLSVERANFARNLYLQEGLEVVDQGIDADTMVLNL